jgi:uncharacterized membrane protein YdjX (TVP38/TMEM64 family)
MSERTWLSGWKLTLARILALAAVIGITIFVFSLRDQAAKLQGYGYPGIFLLSVLANATVILPAPGIALTFAFGAVFNPVLVALLAGAGAALGELTGYLAGFSGQAVIEDSRLYRRLTEWTQHNGGWAIFILACIPNPFFDIAGAAAGALKMPVAKFLLWTLCGKILKMLVIAYAGSASLDWLLALFPSVR